MKLSVFKKLSTSNLFRCGIGIMVFAGKLCSYDGRIYLRNGNIFDGDIYFSSNGVVGVRILNGNLEFDPVKIDKILFNEKPDSINKEFIKKLRKRSDLIKKSEENGYEILIEDIAHEYGVDHLLIKAIMKVESNFNMYAISKKGARGLMQIMPKTAKKLGIKDIFDPHENLKGGIKYLKEMLEKFEGDLLLALAAYNAGPLVVERYKNIPPYSETRKYVREVLKYYYEYKRGKINFYILQDKDGNLYFRKKMKEGLKNLLLSE